MPPASSDDLKGRIPILHAQGYSIKHICIVLGLKKSLVYRVLKRNKLHGVVSNPHPKTRGRRRILYGPWLAAYRDLQKQNPTAHLDELKYKMICHYAINLSPSTLSRTHRRLRITRKKVVVRAQERNLLLQAVFRNRIGDLVTDPYMLVFLDESAKDQRTLIRRYGYGPEGERIEVDAPFVRGQRYSMLPAITLDGIITYKVVEGTITAEIFHEFLSNYVVRASDHPLKLSYPETNLDATHQPIPRTKKRNYTR
jgi:transposase